MARGRLRADLVETADEGLLSFARLGVHGFERLGNVERFTPSEAVPTASAAALLVEIPGARAPLQQIWERQHDTAPPSFFLDQGRMPQGAVALANEKGTAWGFAVQLPRGTRFICHPGPPVECQAAWFGGGRDRPIWR